MFDIWPDSCHLRAAFTAREEHVGVGLVWRCAQWVRSAYHPDTHAAGRAIAEKVVEVSASLPIPCIAALVGPCPDGGKWHRGYLGYFDTGGASNGGTEAVNGLIELHRSTARVFRNRHYRLRMLLIGSGRTIVAHAHP